MRYANRLLSIFCFTWSDQKKMPKVKEKTKNLSAEGEAARKIRSEWKGRNLEPNHKPGTSGVDHENTEESPNELAQLRECVFQLATSVTEMKKQMNELHSRSVQGAPGGGGVAASVANDSQTHTQPPSIKSPLYPMGDGRSFATLGSVAAGEHGPTTLYDVGSAQSFPKFSNINPSVYQTVSPHHLAHGALGQGLQSGQKQFLPQAPQMHTSPMSDNLNPSVSQNCFPYPLAQGALGQSLHSGQKQFVSQAPLTQTFPISSPLFSTSLSHHTSVASTASAHLGGVYSTPAFSAQNRTANPAVSSLTNIITGECKPLTSASMVDLFVDEDLRQKILKGEAVEFHLLLDDGYDKHKDREKKSKQSQKKLEPNQWYKAWNIFSAVLTAGFPHLQQGLFSHFKNVQTIMEKNGDWLKYDSGFRRLIQRGSLQWGAMSSELYVECVATNRTSERSAKSQRQNFRYINNKIRPGMCFNFHRHGDCDDPECKFDHGCGICGFKHPTSQCQKIPQATFGYGRFSSNNKRDGDHDKKPRNNKDHFRFGQK